MLIIMFRAVIIFVLLVLGVRLMGKRTIGELQPYEFVITLVVADLATTPMQDITVPLLYGLIPLFTVFAAHYFVTVLTSKSIKLRKAINGKPFTVIDENGLNFETMTKLNIDVNDILSLIRQQGYFSINEVAYGIIETNGKLSVLENPQGEAPKTIPTALVIEGKIMDANLEIVGTAEDKIQGLLASQNLELENVLLLTTESSNVFIQPKNAKYIVIEGAQL